MKNLLAIVLVLTFSTSAFAQVGDVSATDGGGAAASSATVDTAADSSNSNANQQGNTTVDINFEAPEADTRGIDSPIQSRSVVEYRGEYDVNTVPPVSAPGLTTTLSETCMGSTSAGAGWVGFGFSFGTTWRDSACVRRLDARQLSSLGYNLGAKELMCDSDAVRDALKRAGKPCFKDLPKEVREQVNPAAAADVASAERQVVSGDGGVGEDEAAAVAAGW